MNDKAQFSVDPKDAVVDVDVTTLVDYSFESTVGVNPDTSSDDEEPYLIWAMEFVLEGGLGRLTAPTGEILVFDQLDSLDGESSLPGISERQVDDLKITLDRWKNLSLPLRFLDFGNGSILMEDKQTAIALPPGNRSVRVSSFGSEAEPFHF